MSEHSRSIVLRHHSFAKTILTISCPLKTTLPISSPNSYNPTYTHDTLHLSFLIEEISYPNNKEIARNNKKTAQNPILTRTNTRTWSLTPHLHTHVSPSQEMTTMTPTTTQHSNKPVKHGENTFTTTYKHKAHHLSPSPASKHATTLLYARPENIGWNTSRDKHEHLFLPSNKKLPGI